MTKIDMKKVYVGVVPGREIEPGWTLEYSEDLPMLFYPRLMDRRYWKNLLNREANALRKANKRKK